MYRRQDSGKHAFGISQNLVVPEPQHAKPLPDKPFIPRLIVRIVGMVSAIAFDHDAVVE